MAADKSGMGRRDFLTGVSIGAAALAVTGTAATATAVDAPAAGATPADATGTPVTDSGAHGAAGGAPSSAAASRYGSDFMVDVLRTLDIEYCAINPGSTFEGLQESIINHAGNTQTPSCSRACTKKRLPPWRTATPRPRASR